VREGKKRRRDINRFYRRRGQGKKLQDFKYVRGGSQKGETRGDLFEVKGDDRTRREPQKRKPPQGVNEERTVKKSLQSNDEKGAGPRYKMDHKG